MKSCSVCPQPSFGKDKITGKPYCRSHQHLRTDTDKRSPYEKHMDKNKKENKKAAIKTKVRGLINTPSNKAMVEKSELRSALLKIADNLFSKFIRNRDQDKDGYITCVCCGGRFHVDDKDTSGNKVVQCLHFVPRGVYNYRFSHFNQSGCSSCNKEMHDHPTGLAYRQYKAFLERTIGREEVKAMEDSKRTINNISHADIQAVIDKYKK